jgi:hypothetical protein
MHHNVTFKVLDSALHLRPNAAPDLIGAVNMALLALEKRQPGALDDATPARTIAAAIEAVGWLASWDSPELAHLTTADWLRVPLAGLLTWAEAVRPFLAPGSFLLLAIGDGTSALLLAELRAAGLLVRHNGRPGSSIWLVPQSDPGRLQALREEHNEP